MIKKLAIFGLAAMLTLALAGVASAAPPPSNAANNQNQCENQNNGTWVPGSPNKCIIEITENSSFEDEIVKASGNSGRGWTASGELETTTEYTVTGPPQGNVEETGVDESRNVEECFNPGGKEMDAGHENCQ